MEQSRELLAKDIIKNNLVKTEENGVITITVDRDKVFDEFKKRLNGIDEITG